MRFIINFIAQKIKILLISIIALSFFLIFLEITAGLTRLVLDKSFLPFFNPYPKLENYPPPHHPCQQMKTDTLLTHVPFHENKCSIKDGTVIRNDYRDDYVFYKYSSKKNPLLLILGGSTSSGFYQGYSQGNTYPKYLAELVSAKYFLINGAVGGYSSMEELLKFYRDGPAFKNLEIVISLNGINDYSNKFGKEDYHPFLSEIQFQMNKNQVWIDQRFGGFFNNWFIMNITPNLRSILISLVNRYIYFLKKNDQKYSAKINDNDSFFKTFSSAERWEANVKRINALAKLEGASYLVFLQPTMGIDGPQSYPTPNSNDMILYNEMDKKKKLYFKNINQFYKELKKRCLKLDFCIDISDVAPPTGDVYWDARHHNAKGNKIIANEIFKIIKEKFY